MNVALRQAEGCWVAAERAGTELASSARMDHRPAQACPREDATTASSLASQRQNFLEKASSSKEPSLRRIWMHVATLLADITTSSALPLPSSDFTSNLDCWIKAAGLVEKDV